MRYFVYSENVEVVKLAVKKATSSWFLQKRLECICAGIRISCLGSRDWLLFTNGQRWDQAFYSYSLLACGDYLADL